MLNDYYKLFSVTFYLFALIFSISRRKFLVYLYFQFIFLVALDRGYSFILGFLPIRLTEIIAISIFILDSDRLRIVLKKLRNKKLYIPLLYILSAILNTLLTSDIITISLFTEWFSWLFIFLTFSLFYSTRKGRTLSIAMSLIILGFSINLFNFLSVIFDFMPSILIFDTTIPLHFYASRYGSFLAVIIGVKLTYHKFNAKLLFKLHILLFILYVTIASGGRLQSLAAVVCIFLATKTSRKLFSFIALYVIALIFIVSPDVSTLANSERYERLATYYQTRQSYSAVPSEIDFRYHNIEIAWAGFLDSPLFGQGIRGWQNWASTYTGDSSFYLTVHNSYMHLLVEQGLIGFILLISSLYIILVKYRYYDKAYPRDHLLRTSKLFLISLIIIGFGHSIMIITFYLPMFLGIRSGLLLAYMNKHNKFKTIS